MLTMFRSNTPRALAQRELDDAQRSLLEAHTGLEYATAQVAYNTARVSRLKETLRTMDAEYKQARFPPPPPRPPVDTGVLA